MLSTPASPIGPVPRVAVSCPQRGECSLFRALCGLLLIASLVACAPVRSTVSGAVSTVEGPDGLADMDLASTPTLYNNSKLYTGDVQVAVHPNVNLEARPTALFVPLGLTQPMRDAVAVSHGVSRSLWQQFLQEGTFSTLELAGMDPPYRVELALPLARQMGAGMLVGGYITYYYDGGPNGDSRASIQLEVYDVASGDMLWSIAHAAELPYKPARDFLVVEVKSRMPADPMGVVLARIGADMSRLLHMWTEPNRFRQPAGVPNPLGSSAFGRF